MHRQKYIYLLCLEYYNNKAINGYVRPENVLRTQHILTHLIIITVPGSRYYYLYMTHEELGHG
jgi:hypothetical protein